jgi:hypothetical protein
MANAQPQRACRRGARVRFASIRAGAGSRIRERWSSPVFRGALSLVVLGALATAIMLVPGAPGAVTHGAARAEDADRAALCVAALAFAAACGSLVNTFAPPPAGDATRIALVGRLVARPGGTLTAAGVCGVVALIRALVVAAVFTVAVGAAAATATAIAVVVVVAAAMVAVGRTRRLGRVRHVTDALDALWHCPRLALELVAWVVASTGARLVAATACCVSLGVPHALAAGPIVVAALELATMVPLAPANVGVTSAAVAFALHRNHVDVTAAVSAGIVLQFVETIVGVAIGLAGTLALARPGLRRRAVTALAFAVVAAAVLGMWIDPT